MELPAQVRERLAAQDVPAPVYALVGAAQRVRVRMAAVPDQVSARADQAVSTKDRVVTTAYQVGYETRDRVLAAPGDVADAAKSRWSQLLQLPGDVRSSVTERVIDLRDEASQEYEALTGTGERVVAEWQAQRVLDERAERLTKSVTPAAARASVSARDAARKVAASPTGQRVAEAGRRARESAAQLGEEPGRVAGQPTRTGSSKRRSDGAQV